jgi:hypothetical protein
LEDWHTVLPHVLKAIEDSSIPNKRLSFQMWNVDTNWKIVQTHLIKGVLLKMSNTQVWERML